MPRKARVGRPSIPRKERLGRTIGGRFRPDEEREVMQAIKASQKSMAQWVREKLLEAARRS